MKNFITYNEICRVDKLLEIVDSIPSPQFEKGKSYIFIGCGSSYNAGLIISELLRKNGFTVDCVTAGKVLLMEMHEQIVSNYDYAILISRTGYTSETIKVAELLKGNIRTLGVTCAKGTLLANVCDSTYELDFCHEDSVVMTGSFSAILRLFLNSIRYVDIDATYYLKKFDEMTSEEIISTKEHFVFLGYDERYYIAKESALKVQELSMDHTEFHETLEYRHGPIALLSQNSHVVIFSKFQSASPLEKQLASDVMKRGATVDIITPSIDYTEFEVQVLGLYAQLLGYKRAVYKGLNPDKPHGLTKYVSL